MQPARKKFKVDRQPKPVEEERKSKLQNNNKPNKVLKEEEEANKPLTLSKKKSKLVVIDSNWNKIRTALPTKPNPMTKKVNTIESTTTSSLSIIQKKSTSFSSSMETFQRDHHEIVALDCEMVGDARGRSMLARVCIINEQGKILLDKYVQPPRPVHDYRTKYSGIRPNHLQPHLAVPFPIIQDTVLKVLDNKIVIGHGLKNDFEALQIEHPNWLIRDTSYFHKFQQNGRSRKLKILTLERLNYAIQEGNKGHDPSIDAKAALDLYLKHREEWETMIVNKRRKLTTHKL